MSAMNIGPAITGKLWITLVLSLSVFGLLLTLFVKRSKFLYSLRNVPSPTALPVIGNVWQLNCSLEGDKWHARRKLLTPTFHSGLLESYLSSTIQEATTMVSCLRAEVGKPEFDIVPYAKRAALDMICTSSMGYHINAQTNLNNEYVTSVEKMTAIIQTRFTNIWMSMDVIFNRTSMGKVHQEALDVIHGFVNRVISERKAEWKLKHDGNFNESSKKRLALLDMLLEYSQNGAILSDEDIKDEVNTFMFAGHDTLATSISWVLYALGSHPEYQTKILEEYNNTIDNDEITSESLNKLVWLDACIKEAWRMYPVVPLIARQIYKPINLMNHDVPVGSTVLVNTFLLHRDPRYFPQPDVYKPERFFPNSPKLPAFSYIPFSAGSRNCIGFRFATMETKMTILSILKSYEVRSIEPVDKLRLISSIVLINANGINLKITPRQ
ncbi:cytochrome P450 4c3-like isoform X2 [Venturia canescens]|uniref:cytochrome P450 4c3-like isoform X2 n=1 Tax=Venturia canescens TaxID=32260 RepID=UPI001C9C2FEE|nr:cytochrome P450 4c3-like isoform X2 [Venturia canescens]